MQVPLILLSIFLVTESQFHRMEPLIPRALNLGALALNLPTIVVFGTLYMLAMINKKNTAYHMRYLITLLMLAGIHLLWAFRMSAPWQEFAGIFSGLIF